MPKFDIVAVTKTIIRGNGGISGRTAAAAQGIRSPPAPSRPPSRRMHPVDPEPIDESARADHVWFYLNNAGSLGNDEAFA